MNVYKVIKNITDNIDHDKVDATYYYVGRVYLNNPERIKVRDNGSIVVVLDSDVGRYIMSVLKKAGVDYNLDQGIYPDYNATNLTKAGLLP